MSSILFCPDQYGLNGGIQDTVIKRTNRHTRISEYVCNTFFFQTFYNCICTYHFHSLHYVNFLYLNFPKNLARGSTTSPRSLMALFSPSKSISSSFFITCSTDSAFSVIKVSILFPITVMEL